MLSSRQVPPPVREVAFHVERSRLYGRTHLVWTRRLSGLTPGESRVALYGDVALENRLLGWGTYDRAVALDTPSGRALLDALELYSDGRIPVRARTLIGLTAVQAAPPDAEVSLLAGTIAASGLPLTREHLPDSPGRAHVYYYAAA